MPFPSRRATKRRMNTLETVTVRQSGDVAKTSDTTLANLTGLTQVVEPGVYYYEVRLQTTANASGGVKAGFKLNGGATLTSIQNTGVTMTASAVATARTTTATDQASLVASTTAAVYTLLEGTVVVATGGSLQVQGAQNASNASATTFLTGSTFTLQRIG